MPTDHEELTVATAESTVEGSPDSREGAAPESGPSTGPPAWLRRTSLALLVALITALTLPPGIGEPVLINLDPSWQMMLHRLAGTDLVFGRDIIFTYGPLGFLANPGLFAGTTGAASVAVAVASQAALVVLTLWVIKRWLPLWLAAVITWLGLACTSAAIGAAPPLVWVLIVTTGSVMLLARPQTRITPWIAVAAGLAIGVVALTKLDTAIVLGATTAATVVLASFRDGGIDRAWKRTLAFGGAAIGALVAGWLLVGQPLGALPDWLRTSTQIVRGYAQAMGGEIPERAWEYPAALLLTAALFVFVWRATTLATRERVMISIVVALALAIGFRQGFVRHDGHSVQFFALFVFIPLALLPYAKRVEAGAFSVVALVMLMAAGQVNAADALAIPRHLSGTWNAVAAVVSPSVRDDVVDDGLADARREYPISRELLDIIDGAPTIVGPAMLQSGFAYGDRIGFASVPVFQEYAAYTSALDDANARVYADPDGAEFVLRQPGYSIDGRIGRWEAPGATLELVCNFGEVGRAEPWVLLQRRSSNGCGAIDPIETVEARFAEPIDLPDVAGDDLLVARFEGIGDSLGDRLQTLIFRSPPVFVGSSGDDTLSRFVIGTQGSWHIVAGPECARTMIDNPYVAPVFDDLVFSSEQDTLAGSDRFTAEFARVPFSCASTPSAAP